jgi:hypothetical protein
LRQKRRIALAAWLLALAGCAQLIGLSGDYKVRPKHDAGSDSPHDGGHPGSGDGDMGDGDQPPHGDGDAGMVVPSFKIPKGKLVYHHYSDYFAGDSEMWLVDFPSGKRGDELGQTYGLCNPLNGIFSPDGSKLVVGALPRDGDCQPTDKAKLEVYILDLAHPGQKQQVTQNDLEDEDPQFSALGDYLVFKHDGHVAEWPVGDSLFTTCDALPEGSYCYGASGEQSKPVVTPDNKTICYYEAHLQDSDIYCFDRELGHSGASVDDIRMAASMHDGVNDSRPTFDRNYLYYTRGRAVNNQVTFIARVPVDDLTGVGEPAAFCTDEASYYTDPCSLGSDLMMFASNQAGLGGYDLFVGSYDSPHSVSLDHFAPGVNSAKNDFGPNFWRDPNQ